MVKGKRPQPPPEQQPYKRPPITEAVIGITFADDLPADKLRPISNIFSRHYPGMEEFKRIGIKVSFQAGQVSSGTPLADDSAVFKGASRDAAELVVLAPNQFTVSVLAPYPGWGIFFPRFKRDWQLYKKHAGFRKITRIGVRFINRIDIPAPPEMPVVPYADYILIHPETPEEFSPTQTFAMQTVFRRAAIGCMVNINVGVLEPVLLETAAFLLDIDLHCDVNTPMLLPGSIIPQNDKDIFALLGAIRLEKNHIFEACITGAARELFQR